MKKEKGFTLIELVIVRVILGVLAATGLSKFMDVTEEAKNASVEGTASGFAAGVMMVRGQWEAKGRPQTYSVNSIFYDGTWLQLTTPTRDQRENKGLMPGYPMEAGKPTQKTGSTSVTPADALSASSCLNIWYGMLQNAPKASTDFGDVKSSASDYKYYVAYQGSADSSDTAANSSSNPAQSIPTDYPQHCVYYMLSSLNRNDSGDYMDPCSGGKCDTSRYKSFSYYPANGTVRTHIHNAESAGN